MKRDKTHPGTAEDTDKQRPVEIGLDDTDSETGMCTTYIAYRLIERLLKSGAAFDDYPRLIRLNPNVPWKTRGNGAVALRLRTEDPAKAFEEACRIVSEYAETERAADPGVVASTLETTPKDIEAFAERALSEIVSRREATGLLKKHNLRFRGWGKQRGLIGALAAIGNRLSEDATYELIAFRSEANWGWRRSVDPESVRDMNRKTHPYTFNSYDEEKERVLITPRGPDPVLLGIRGEDPETVLRAYRMLKIGETRSGHLIFKTNQGTAAHLKLKLDPANLKAYWSGYLRCVVSERPRVGRGGHVYFRGENERGCVTFAAYEPTGGFRKTVLALIPGDQVEIGGSVRKRTRRHDAVINVEYLRIIRLTKDKEYRNPLCRRCGKRTASQGRGQGFRCDACGFEDGKAGKITVERPRTIREGLYLPPPRAQRHLTKPRQRYLLHHPKTIGLIDGWFEAAALITTIKT